MGNSCKSFFKSPSGQQASGSVIDGLFNIKTVTDDGLNVAGAGVDASSAISVSADSTGSTINDVTDSGLNIFGRTSSPLNLSSAMKTRKVTIQSFARGKR